MKNIIEYFYRIEIDKITYINEKYYIFSDGIRYVFEEYKNRPSIDILVETQRYNKFHTVISNVRGNIITNYENINYILFRINIGENRKITLDDIVEVSLLPVNGNLMAPDWNLLWMRKIDIFERYIMNKDIDFKFREYYDYFIGMGENAIMYFNYTRKDGIRNGFTYNRVRNDYTLYDLFDPLNVVFSPVVKGISEYIKSSFFSGSEIEIEEIERLNLNYYDSIMLISRMLFPTYFFDLCKNGKEEDLILMQKIIYLSPSYEKYISIIFKNIKKRHKMMPQIKWLYTNQL